MKNNYFELTVREILELAETNDLDNKQLATRLARRLSLGVTNGCRRLTDDEQHDWQALATVTDRNLEPKPTAPDFA
jgi:hypothetical protein